MRSEEDEPTERLIPPGNPGRPRRLWLALAALTPLFLLMASDRHFGLSVPCGVALLLVAAFALLDVLGSFDDAASEVSDDARVPTLIEVAPRLVGVAAAL